MHPQARPRRQHITLGSVGQPRDGDPAARPSVRSRRVAYDVARCLAKADREGLLLWEDLVRARIDRWSERIETGLAVGRSPSRAIQGPSW